MRNRFAIVVTLLLAATVPAGAQTFSVAVKVVDADGKPVPKAEVGLRWLVINGKLKNVDTKPMFSDADGKAIVRVPDWNTKQKHALLIYSEDRTRGAIVGVGKTDADKEVRAEVGPTVRVTARLECKELKTMPDFVNTIVFSDAFKSGYPLECRSNSSVDVMLPAGKYRFNTYGQDLEKHYQTCEVVADRSEFDLGTIDMKASTLAKLRGKPCPEWSITEARGVPGEVKLSDYKGKWVYIEFWGFW